MSKLLARLFRRTAKTPHKHRWIEKDYQRHCACGAHQMLMQNRYPAVGEPSLEWIYVP